MKRIFTVIGMGLMVLMFQNCQKTSVSSAGNSLEKVNGELMPVSGTDVEDAEGTLLQPDAPTETAPVTDPNSDSGSGNVCILEGSGKSIKLGLSAADALGGQHKIPRVLCMSARACLEIASEAFGVKGPEFRGYCKLPHGNPHVVHISEAALQGKVNSLLNP